MASIKDFFAPSKKEHADVEKPSGDLEKGLTHGSSVRHLTDISETSPSPSQSGSDAANVPEPENELLETFRAVIGITSRPSLMRIGIIGRPAPNLGLYGRVCHSEYCSKRMYKMWSILINSCLGLQIIVAAALTALGAAGGSNGAAVTTFGAVNTVIAGFLTYLKGSGLPNRIKFYQNEWRKLREYIEQRERDFGVIGCTLSLEEELMNIERMFEEVKADIEANTPDKFVSTGGAQSGRRGVAPLPTIARPLRGSTAITDGSSQSGKELEAGRPRTTTVETK